MTLLAVLLVMTVAAAVLGTIREIRRDTPREIPSSHAVDPAFLPPARAR